MLLTLSEMIERFIFLKYEYVNKKKINMMFLIISFITFCNIYLFI